MKKKRKERRYTEQILFRSRQVGRDRFSKANLFFQRKGILLDLHQSNRTNYLSSKVYDYHTQKSVVSILKAPPPKKIEEQILHLSQKLDQGLQ